MSTVRALKKLRAGAGADMSDGERDKLVQELKAARDKLKEGEIAKSEMIVKSCRQAGLFTLPDTNGILDAILAKGSHKSMIRTVAYDPQSKQLRTCVNKDTYDAANDFINKGGIDAFKKASGGLMSTLDDFNKAWNDTEKLLAPFVVGSVTLPVPEVKDDKGNVINTCEASTTEEQCFARRTTLAGKAGDACVWMPNFAHLSQQIKAAANDMSGNDGAKLETAWAAAQQKVCAPVGDIPLPMRDATMVDQTALRSGRQLSEDKKRGMGSSGSMVRLNANAYKENTAFAEKDVKNADLPAAFQLRYPNFSTVTPFGTTKRMPYLYKYENGKATVVTPLFAPTDSDASGAASGIQAAVRGFLTRNKLASKLPEKIQNKLKRISERSASLKEEITAELNKTDGGLSYWDFQKKLNDKLKENSKYVSPSDQEDYALYQLAKAGALDQADVNKIMQASLGNEKNNIIVTSTDSVDVAGAWKTLLGNSGLTPDEQTLLSEKLANTAKYGRSGNVGSLNDKDKVYFAEDGNKLGALKDFLTGGGDTTGNMLPVVMPPKGSEAAQQMFVTFNHGPMDVFGSQQTQLSGGGLMTDSPNLVRSGEEDKAVDQAFGKIKAEKGKEAKNDTKIDNALPFFYLNKEAILLLKGNLAKYAPMLHNFYAQQAEKVKRVTSNAQTEVKVGELDESTKKWMTVFAALRAVDTASFYDDNASKFNDRNPKATAPAIADTDAAVVPLLWDPQSGLAKYDQNQNGANYVNKAGAPALREGKSYTQVTGYKFPAALIRKSVIEELSQLKSARFSGKSLLAYLFSESSEFAAHNSEKAAKLLQWLNGKSGATYQIELALGQKAFDGSNGDAADGMPEFKPIKLCDNSSDDQKKQEMSDRAKIAGVLAKNIGVNTPVNKLAFAAITVDLSACDPASKP